MNDFLPGVEGLAPWHWWILGALLLIAELAVPGSFFVWLAASAFMTGLVVFVLPIPVAAQLLLFALLALVTLYAGRRYVGKLNVGEDASAGVLNRRGASYVGRVLIVAEPIVNGFGRVRVADGEWRARGPDAEVGRRVRVVAVEGTTLVVEHADTE